ncbi:hypothetical protein BDW72DRAFT_210172 [Aspergillus terricola var. indicus]
MDRLMIPSVLRPDYVWPRLMQSVIQQTTPQVPVDPADAPEYSCTSFTSSFITSLNVTAPSLASYLMQTLFLPFGLVMNWTDRTSVEAAVSMQIARSAEIPVPKYQLCNTEEPWLEELKSCITSMRSWHSPGVEAFYSYLLAPVSAHAYKTDTKYYRALIISTHGDLKAHNILVDDDGHLSGFLDWKSVGWYPDYWDLLRLCASGRIVGCSKSCLWIGGAQYWDELDSNVTLNLLIVDSYIVPQ